jgi:hypothetical protein
VRTILQILITAFLGSSLFGVTAFAFSNRNSSIALTYRSAKVNKIANGLIHKTLNYNKLFNARQVVNVVEIDLRLRQLKPVNHLGCQRISDAGPKNTVLAAVNGTFFGADCSPRNFLKIDGKLLGTNIIRKAGSAAFLLNALKFPSVSLLTATENPPQSTQGIGGFPLLVANGEVNIQPKESTNFFRHRYARTALGIIDQNHIVFLTVDGGSWRSAGFTIKELATYLESYGVIAALNLDGGTSTTMWINSAGVVNRPSSARGEAEVANSIAVF